MWAITRPLRLVNTVKMATDVIGLRYAGACSVCGAALPVSTKAHWDKAAKTATCLECGGPTRVSATARDSPAESPPVPPVPVRPESGRAGFSAQREYERRHEKREELLDRRFGRFAGVVKFLVDDPQSTRAWAKGSEGERILADALTRRIGDLGVLLHDHKRTLITFRPTRRSSAVVSKYGPLVPEECHRVLARCDDGAEPSLIIGIN